RSPLISTLFPYTTLFRSPFISAPFFNPRSGQYKTMAKALEHFIERGPFASRWIMAPMYVGLAAALLLLLYSFAMELVHLVIHVRSEEHTSELQSRENLVC